MSSPRNASGLARINASMVWSRLKAWRIGRPLAIADKVSPAFTGPYCADAASAAGALFAGSGVRAGAGSGVGAMALLPGAGSAAGAAASGACAAGTGIAGTTRATGRCTTLASGVTGTSMAAATGALAVFGASTSAEYSRTSRPCPQSTSIRKFSTAWSTGWIVVTRITGRPRASLPRLNFRLAATPLGGARPTRRKVSGEASRACSASSLPGVVEMIGISASNGWLRRDLTSIWPSPNAQALPAASNKAAAIAPRIFPITCLPLPRRCVAL